MEMTECTFQYKYGAVTFYNRVFDGETTDYVWGSCLDTCPAFTRAPYCGKSEEVPQIGQLELREDEKCTPGEYLQASGKCQRCPVGHYSGEAEASECQPCAAGTMQPNEGQTNASRARTGGTRVKSVSNTANPALARERTRRDASYKAACSIR